MLIVNDRGASLGRAKKHRSTNEAKQSAPRYRGLRDSMRVPCCFSLGNNPGFYCDSDRRIYLALEFYEVDVTRRQNGLLRLGFSISSPLCF